jgi:16S rRNA (guanine527-N7)-methyltransferase
VKKEFDFIGQLRKGCQALDLAEPDAQAAEKLIVYFTELKHWSRRVNLIAKNATDEEILEKHFLDSMTLLPFLAGDNPHLLDIGTGAGFPGLVCKVVMPELKVTLVEPRLKRVSFLRHIVRTLQLQDIKVLECRVEDTEKLPADGGFTHITSRAVSDIKVFLAMCSRFAGPELSIICMKGPKWKEELSLYLASGEKQVFSFSTAREYCLPNSKSLRNVMAFE